MSGKFLTPAAIWKNFNTGGEIKAEVLRESAEKGFGFTHIRISGRKTADGEVSIYAVLTRKAQLTLSPAVVVVQDFCDGADTTLAKKLAEQGYTVLTIDLAGSTERNLNREIKGVDKPYTVYPDSLSYANFDETTVKKAEIEGDAFATCWYEWGRVIRYSVEYIKSNPLVTKVGVIGIGEAATPLWHVLTANCGLSCAVIVGNAGWKGYRGIRKFADMPEPQFNDDALKYLAGVEPQAYAAHVKCPLMLLAPTNSPDYDIDRAYDTVSRISADIYTAVDYTVGGRKCVSTESFGGALTFLDAYLLKDAPNLADEVSLKITAENGEIKAEVSPDPQGLKKVSVYFAEEEPNPALRSWNKEEKIVSEKNGTYTFKYVPYSDSKTITYFARAEYANGLNVCSVVGCKKLEGEEFSADNRHRVLYSSRSASGLNGYYPAAENDSAPFGIDLNGKAVVKVKNGPMDIYGVYCEEGIVTFKVNMQKYKPAQGAMLMLDVFVKGGGDFCVKAITDYYGRKTEYTAKINIFGDLWQNVKLETNNFKTAEGMGLKSYENVEALEFSSAGKFIVNNLLWV